MGFYDRDYERDDYGGGGYRGSYGEPGVRLRMPQSITVRLILVNVAVYLLQILFAPQFLEIFSLHEYWYREPWRIIGFLTSGFLHSEETLWHLLGNMIVLFFFGRAVEERYGSREFLAVYLAGIIFSGICWNVIELMSPNPIAPDGREIVGVVLGASGGLSTILALFILNFPHVRVYIYFLFPVPAWVLGVFWLAGDVLGALGRSGNVAFTAHLGGALLGLLYYKLGWRLTDLVPRDFKLPSFKRRPNLRVHRGDADAEDSLDAQVDRILDKIKEQGQDSLTAAEKKILQKGSAAYRKRHQ